jgi:hypothetical protein
MAILLHDCGARAMLKGFFPNLPPANPKTYYLCLYTNSALLVDTDTAANMREAYGGGYARIALPVNTWSVPDTGAIPEAENIERLFTFTGPLADYPDVKGYYVLDADGTLLFSEPEETPYTPVNNGDTLAITPSFMLSKGTPS